MFKKLLKTILVCILVVAIYFVSNAASVYIYSYQDETTKSDVAIVLGASVGYTTVSPVFRERINHAIELYHKGDVKKIIFTGGKIAGQKYSDSAIAKKYAIKEGVDENDILIEEKSKMTFENLKYAKSIMKENNYTTAIIVSDALHMRRAMRMADDLGIKAYTSPTTTSMYKTTDKRMHFLFNETISYIGYKWAHLLGMSKM